MSRVLSIALSGALLAAHGRPQLAAFPQGWTLLLDSTGRCSYGVPADWKVDATAESANSMVASPDGRIVATINWSKESSARQAADIIALRHQKVVHENSAARVWIELAPMASLGVLHVAVAPSENGSCTIEIVVSDRSREEHRRVVPAIVATLSGIR
jgi:hypothetical protein